MDNKKPIDEVIEFVKHCKDDYNNAMRDKKIVDNYVSGNGLSEDAVKSFESSANGNIRARAKVNAAFISGYINQLEGLLIANQFDLSKADAKPGLVNSLNNAAQSALNECLNYGEGFLYIDGETIKSIGRQNIIVAKCDEDNISDCNEAIIVTTKQMDGNYQSKRSEIAIVLEASTESTTFTGKGRTAVRVHHYKVKDGKLTIRTFVDDEQEGKDIVYDCDWLPISRAVCKKVLDGNNTVHRGLYHGVRDLLDSLSISYSVIRSKVSNNPDAFAVVDKRALNDKAVADAWDAPFGRSVLPYIGSITSSVEGAQPQTIPPPQPLVIPFNIAELHQDIGIVKQDIQNILGFNYAYEDQKGNETVEAALLRKENSYNSKVAYIKPVAQAVIHLVKVYNVLLKTSYEVVNKVFVKIERDEKLRKVLAIIQNPQKGYEALLAKFAGFSDEEVAEIVQVSGIAQVVANANNFAAENEQLKAALGQLKMELMNYRLDTAKTVESNQIRANVQLAKIEVDAQIEAAKIAQKDVEIANRLKIEVAKLVQKAQADANDVDVPNV